MFTDSIFSRTHTNLLLSPPSSNKLPIILLHVPHATRLTHTKQIYADTPYLYDFVMTHSLEWPSLTCEWLPTVRNTAGPESVEHSLLIGTHTTGEQNYLMVASCNLPVDEAVVEDEKEKTDEENAPNHSGTGNNNKKAPPGYDEEKKELGAFGHADRTVGKIEIKMKIKHEGEVNRYV